MGTVTVHRVDILTEKGKTTSKCTCGWKCNDNIRSIVFSQSHLHIAEQALLSE